MPVAVRSGGRLFAIAITLMAALDGRAEPGHATSQNAADIPVVRLEGSGRQAPSLPVTRLDEGQRSADLDAVRALSLTCAEPLPVRDVLLMLFRGTPFSIVFDPAVTGTFIGELTDLTLRQALEAVLHPAGLDYDVHGRVIRVFPRRPQTRLFEVSHVDVKRAWQRRVRSVTAGDEPALAADLSSAAESDFFQELGEGVHALLSPSGRVHIDRNAGVVQVTDFADRLDQVGVYVEAVTLRATRQVRLHARVLEVTLGGVAAVDWTAVASRSGIRAGTGAGIRVDDFDALLRAIGGFGAVRMIASPQILAMNNEPAVMRVGSHDAVFTSGWSRADRGQLPAPSGGMTSGLTLTITPQIAADGIVHMSVSPTYVESGPRTAGSTQVSVVEADTMMRVREGETVVISGLLREVEETAPASGSSGASRGREQTARRAELIILLTPTVVNPGSQPVAGAQ